MMFSQLCRAKPSALRNKFGIRQQLATEDNETPRTSDIEFNGEDRCQLEQCTFCEFRLCCQVTSCSSHNWETECLPNSDPDTQVTENPAYGLSSKNWLEAKEVKNDGRDVPKVLNMELTENFEQNIHCDITDESSVSNILLSTNASQQDQVCDVNSAPKMNQVNFQSHFQQNKMELKAKSTEESEAPKPEICCTDTKHGKLTWSVLRHRQCGDILKNCDNKTNNVIEHLANDTNHQAASQEKIFDQGFMFRTKKNIKERSFPLSLMRPIAKMGDKKPENLTQHFTHTSKNDLSRQRHVQRYDREKFQNSNAKKDIDKSKRISNDILGLNSNPLSDIAQIKAEESVQEWLARIGESAANSAWLEDSEGKNNKDIPPAWSLGNNTDEEKGRDSSKPKASSNYHADMNDKIHRSAHLTEISRSREKLCYDDLTPKTESDTTSVLFKATKASPANVPMVVMQCSRLHSHTECKPPFQQTSLPMGTLVTALYQESDWLYIQTPHGIEGFVSASNCVPIGTINEPAQASKPWEPCDFPIQICLHKRHEVSRQQGSYIPAKLPTNNGKQAAPYVSTVKMKTNFYSDRYFSHTFKSKDSIKTAKTVTDILRSSPETKISNQ